MLEPFTRHSLVGDFSEFGVRERPRRCCPAPVLLDHHLTLHALLFMTIDWAVHLVPPPRAWHGSSEVRCCAQSMEKREPFR